LAVTVDIPGIGSVVANNAAQDSTLTAILGALRNMDSGGGGAGGAGAQRFDVNAGKAARSAGRLNQSFDSLDSSVQNTSGVLAQSARYASGFISSLTKGAAGIAANSSSMQGAMGDISDTAAKLANATVGRFGAIGKIVGGTTVAAFSVLSGALAKQVDSYNSAAQSGFDFGYSMDNMRNVANTAGLQLDQLTNALKQSASSVALFGGGTASGARVFAQLNKQVRDGAGKSMLRMGIGFEEQAARTAETIENLQLAGMSFDEISRSGDRVAAVTQQRAVLESQLAKINGTTLAQEREKAKQQNQDAVLQATLMGANTTQREAMKALEGKMNDLAPGMGRLALEYFKFGGAVSETGGVLESQFGAVAGPMKEFVAQVKSGQASMSDLPAFLAGIDKGALDQQRAGMADIASTAALTGTNLGTFGQVANDSVIGMQRFAAQLGPDGALAKVIENTKKMAETGGPITENMLSMQKALQDASTAFSTTMTDLIGGPIGTLVGDINVGILEYTKEAAEYSGKFVRSFNDAVKQLDSTKGLAGEATKTTPEKTATTTQEPGWFESIKDFFGNLLEFNDGTMGSGNLFQDFGSGTLAMLHGREAVVTETQMANLMGNFNAFREGVANQLAQEKAAYGGAVSEDTAMLEAQQLQTPGPSVMSLKPEIEEAIMNIAMGTIENVNATTKSGDSIAELLEELNRNTA
jgi:hypothetical protein